MPTTKIFKGLNNVSDPLRLGVSWLAQADNVDITDTGAIRKRDGYSQTFQGAITGAYSTIDFARMFVVDSGVLKALTGPTSAVPLRTGLSPAPMHFTEVNDQVFYNNGVDRGVILPGNTVADWDWDSPTPPTLAAVTGSLDPGTYQVCFTYTLPGGRESGAGESTSLILPEGHALQVTDIPLLAGGFTNVYIAPADSTVFQRAFTSAGAAAFVWNDSPDNLGVELKNQFLDALPEGSDIVQHWKGRIYAAQYFASDDQSAVWFSQPLGYHLFDWNTDFILVPGRVTMLAPHADALIIGTDTRVWAYSGNKLAQLAPYGVPPGWHWTADGDRLLFWSQRGLCSALPFANLTEAHVSVRPGVQAGGTLVQRSGHKRYLVALHSGGFGFNSYI